MAESQEKLKNLLTKVKEQSLKLNIQKTKIIASSHITSWQIDGKTMETVADFISGAPESLQMVTEAMKLRRLLLGRKVMTNLDRHIKKQRHYFVNKGLSSQSYGFSSGPVQM